ncbi:MAG: hypothetical protein PHH70_05915, partial [Candidatus Gracilibacteria bacterium]|nr:hypothetical protein [Candidatus Gracilibacteria bacterium]
YSSFRNSPTIFSMGIYGDGNLRVTYNVYRHRSSLFQPGNFTEIPTHPPFLPQKFEGRNCPLITKNPINR